MRRLELFAASLLLALSPLLHAETQVQVVGLFPGAVRRFPGGMQEEGETLKVPHMGWNEVSQAVKHPLWHDIPDQARFYFVHSYYIEAGKPQQVVGRGHYGKDFAAALAEGSRFAVQFHPEKSHTHGLQLLHCRAVEARMQQIFGGKIPHPQQAHFHLLRFQALAYVIQQQLGARTRRRAAGKQHNMHDRCLAMV